MNKYSYYFLALLLIFSCKKERVKYKNNEGFIFGTTYKIKYQSSEDFYANFEDIFFQINKSMSTYMPTSDISRVNRNDSTVVLTPYFIEVFKKSKQIYEETDGYFDPTLGKVIDAYGFGSGKQIDNLTDSQLNELMKSVGFDKVSLKNGKIEKQNPDIEFNVNAVAKGYALDVIGRFFESKNIFNYLIEIGGEIRVKGKNEKGKYWTIAIDDPNTDGTRSQSKFISLKDESMASSGNYRKFRIDNNGKKYVHTINSKTGLAKESNLLSATVIAARDCADVDAYATAFMAMGLEKSKNFLKLHPDLKVVFLYTTNNHQEIKEYTNFD